MVFDKTLLIILEPPVTRNWSQLTGLPRMWKELTNSLRRGWLSQGFSSHNVTKEMPAVVSLGNYFAPRKALAHSDWLVGGRPTLQTVVTVGLQYGRRHLSPSSDEFALQRVVDPPSIARLPVHVAGLLIYRGSRVVRDRSLRRQSSWLQDTAVIF
jgi:hypothetical protein